MLVKIISIETVNDRKFGNCTKICANQKPKGIKSILPYSRVSCEYDAETFKFFVEKDSMFENVARAAKMAGSFLDINMDEFDGDYDFSLDDSAMDSLNRYSNIILEPEEAEESYMYREELENNNSDIFSDYRTIMFLDSNPTGQEKEYNVMATSTKNGYVNGNYNFAIVADSREDAISQVINQIAAWENRYLSANDLLSCVISPA